MIIRFRVRNFLSFDDNAELLMTKGAMRKHPHHVIGEGRHDVKVLKSGLLYGANAAGKSNLVKALNFMRNMVLKGPDDADKLIDYPPFKLNEGRSDRDSELEIEIKYGDNQYLYGFRFNKREIKEEWLALTSKTDEKLLFERERTSDGANTITIGQALAKGDEAKGIKLSGERSTGPNQLFLNEVFGWNDYQNIPHISNILTWFDNNLKIIFPNTRAGFLPIKLNNDQKFKEEFERLIKSMNTGITSIQFKELDFDAEVNDLPEDFKKHIAADLEIGEKAILGPVGPSDVRYEISRKDEHTITAHKLYTRHKMADQDIDFEFQEESDGTKRLFDLLPMLVDLRNENVVYVVDEIERSLHPCLVHDFLDLYFKTTEGVGSQFIATTHESSLLDLELLRHDEIWFVEKNDKQASVLYSLEDFNTRYDKDVRRGYLSGRYGAVPVINKSIRVTPN